MRNEDFALAHFRRKERDEASGSDVGIRNEQMEIDRRSRAQDRAGRCPGARTASGRHYHTTEVSAWT